MGGIHKHPRYDGPFPECLKVVVVRRVCAGAAVDVHERICKCYDYFILKMMEGEGVLG